MLKLILVSHSVASVKLQLLSKYISIILIIIPNLLSILILTDIYFILDRDSGDIEDNQIDLAPTYDQVLTALDENDGIINYEVSELDIEQNPDQRDYATDVSIDFSSLANRMIGKFQIDGCQISDSQNHSQIIPNTGWQQNTSGDSITVQGYNIVSVVQSNDRFVIQYRCHSSSRQSAYVPNNAYYWYNNDTSAYGSYNQLHLVSDDTNSAIVSLAESFDTISSYMYLDATQFNFSFLGI